MSSLEKYLFRSPAYVFIVLLSLWAIYMWRRQWQPTPVFLPGKSHGWRSLGRLQSMGLLRVRHDWVTSLSLFTLMHWKRKWQSTPVFLPGEFQGWGAAFYGVAQSWTRSKWLSSCSSYLCVLEINPVLVASFVNIFSHFVGFFFFFNFIIDLDLLFWNGDKASSILFGLSSPICPTFIDQWASVTIHPVLQCICNNHELRNWRKEIMTLQNLCTHPELILGQISIFLLYLHQSAL